MIDKTKNNYRECFCVSNCSSRQENDPLGYLFFKRIDNFYSSLHDPNYINNLIIYTPGTNFPQDRDICSFGPPGGFSDPDQHLGG